MEISDFRSFEEAKENYAFKLSKFLNDYNFTLTKYAEKIEEKNVNKIINPRDEKELTTAIKCLEVISGSLEYATSRNLKVEESLIGTFYYLLAKGYEDKKYFAIAQDYINNILADPLLYGNYIVDDIIFDLEDIQKYFQKFGIAYGELNAAKAVVKCAFKSIPIIIKSTAKEVKNKDSYLTENSKKTKGKKGAEKYAGSHDLVFGYLNNFNNQQNIGDTFAMTYRNKYRL